MSEAFKARLTYTCCLPFLCFKFGMVCRNLFGEWGLAISLPTAFLLFADVFYLWIDWIEERRR